LSGGTVVTAMAPSKRLSQIQCALLACERLDEACLLQISSLWNKRKNYTENDFYEEDEDTFFDRTGQLEEQREKRKKRYEVRGKLMVFNTFGQLMHQKFYLYLFRVIQMK
jgi:hypothetical protein